MRTNNINGFLHPTAFGDRALNDEDFFAGRDFKSAPQDQFAFLFFRKDEAHAELPGDFLADNQSIQRRRDNRDRAELADFFRQCRADLSTTGIC